MAEVTKAGAQILWLLKQVGKAYRLGAEHAPIREDDFGNPYMGAEQKAWDCSELVQNSLIAADVRMVGATRIEEFDGAANQYRACPKKISVAAAHNLPGALVFAETAGKITHVAVVIAKDTIVEARGKDYGVVVGPLRSSFTKAAKVLELYEAEA